MLAHARGEVIKRIKRPYHPGNDDPHHPGWIPSHWPARINRSDADIVQLHWIAADMMSIEDVGAIRKPSVWTIHDMWPFCGAEHYVDHHRWREGYLADNRPNGESGHDMNRHTWERKLRHWTRPIHIAAPSRWLAQCARESVLMRDWPVSVVPNPIDTRRWTPVDRLMARRVMDLPTDAPVLLFGAIHGGRIRRKGFDLLLHALDHLRGESSMKEAHLVIFGEPEPKTAPALGFPVHFVGHLHDDLSLRILYSAADAMVIPSRQDNLPNTGLEAHACGTPVIAFDIGGLPDIVDHRRTGYLAKPFDTEDLAEGIRWVLGQREDGHLGVQARTSAVDRFSYPVIAEAYRKVYEAVMT